MVTVSQRHRNAIAAIKAAVRRQPSITDGLLCRGYERIGLDPAQLRTCRHDHWAG